MKKRNGFTLIELLAVIVILAVIALIAVPRIIKLLDQARLSAAEDSTMGIVEAAESYIANFMLQNHGTIPSEDLEFSCNSSEGCKLITELESYDITNLDKLNYKGKKVSSGNITISNGGNNIITTNLEVNGYICGYIGGISECIEKSDEVKESGTIVYFNPETGMQCDDDYSEENSDTENKTGCMKWYIYNDSSDSMAYNLLLDHNTTAIVPWNSQNNNKDASEINAKLREDTKSWQDNLNARLITADEVAQIVGKDDFVSNISDENQWFYFQDLSQITETGEGSSCKDSGCKYAWLYDRTNYTCKEDYGCANNAVGATTYAYWTSTAVTNTSNKVWCISRFSRLHFDPVNCMLIGLRPVITIPKSLIKN